MSVIKSNLPINDNEDTNWDASEAIKNVKAWASNEDGEIDFKKYRKAFFFVDDDNDGGQKQGDYKLPFADVFDGELKAIWKGVAAAMGAVNGARDGVDLGDDSDEKKALYNQICTYYKKFDKESPEFAKALQREIGGRVDILCSMDSTTVKDLGDGVFEATITTSEVDRHQESIATGGINTSNWEKNPVVLYGNDYQELPIGKGLSLRAFKNKMTARFQLAVKEYPFADTVAKLIKGGYLNAVSIGGVVQEWSDDFSQILRLDLAEVWG